MTRVLPPLLAALLFVIAGCANQPDVGGTIEVGKVEGVYVEQYAGVFVDRRVAGDVTGKPLWVHVRFAEPLSDGRKFATAMARQDLGIEPGDLVQLRFRLSKPAEAEILKDYNVVTALVAKHFSAAAAEFGHPERRALQTLTQAGAAN
jgi:hypothetical protein